MVSKLDFQREMKSENHASTTLQGMEVHLTFDESRPLDASGKKNHGSGEVMAASGIGGAGSSALFRNNYVYVPSSESFMSADFSYTFFVYLLQDAKSRLVLLLQL